VRKRLPGISAGRIILFAAGVLVVYFLASGAANIVRSRQLNEQEGQLQAEIDDLETRYNRLVALEQYLDSDEYIEAIAREQLGLVRPGETAFIAIPAEPTPTPAPGEQPELWWETLIR
jgi:cell division protein FtsL